MIFDLEYARHIKTNQNGKVDIAYVPKNQKLRNEMKKRMKKYKIELDSIKN